MSLQFHEDQHVGIAIRMFFLCRLHGNEGKGEIDAFMHGLDALGGAGSHLLKLLPQCAGRSHQQWKRNHWIKSARAARFSLALLSLPPTLLCHKHYLQAFPLVPFSSAVSSSTTTTYHVAPALQLPLTIPFVTPQHLFIQCFCFPPTLLTGCSHLQSLP